MERVVHAIGDSPILQNMIANPMMAIAIVVVAFVLAKLLKLTGKVIKIIILVGVAYVLVNFFMSGVV